MKNITQEVKVHDGALHTVEIAMYYLFHIKNPCKVVVNGREENLRNLYLREARNALPFLNSNARNFLEEIINYYEKYE